MILDINNLYNFFVSLKKLRIRKFFAEISINFCGVNMKVILDINRTILLPKVCKT